MQNNYAVLITKHQSLKASAFPCKVELRSKATELDHDLGAQVLGLWPTTGKTCK